MKKIVALLIVAVITCTLLAGCGGKSDNDKTITVGASVTPHAEILEEAKDILKEKGYTLKIVEYTDYVIPNTATESGELDANYFQHQPYLDQFNQEHETHLVSVAGIHYEPFCIYAGKTSSLDELKDGATIIVPNDGTNEARALMLLESNGLIKLKDGVGLSATKLDVESNPHNFDIKELEAAQLPLSLKDSDIAVINGNYALGYGLKASESLAAEDANSAALTYQNVVVVKEGNENNEGIKALVEALKSEKVKKFIDEKYSGGVVAVF